MRVAVKASASLWWDDRLDAWRWGSFVVGLKMDLKTIMRALYGSSPSCVRLGASLLGELKLRLDEGCGLTGETALSLGSEVDFASVCVSCQYANFSSKKVTRTMSSTTDNNHKRHEGNPRSSQFSILLTQLPSIRTRTRYQVRIDAVPGGSLRAGYCWQPGRHPGRWSTSGTPPPNRGEVRPRQARCEPRK